MELNAIFNPLTVRVCVGVGVGEWVENVAI